MAPMPEVSALLDAEVPWVELSARLPHAPWGGPLGGALLGHRPPREGGCQVGYCATTVDRIVLGGALHGNSSTSLGKNEVNH